MTNERFKESGKYCICWCGEKSNLVYVAWFNNKAIGYFKMGSNDEKLKQAEAACKEHHQLNKEVAHDVK